MTSPAVLDEKLNRYRSMLKEAIDSIEITPMKESYLEKVALDFSNMARSYYEDGLYFIDKDDKVNALACFSYGHAWLDAGVRLGVFKVSDEKLFVI